MKTFLISTVFIFCSLSAAHASGNEYQLGIDGLACPFCTYGIEKQLLKLDGVAELETDIAGGLVTIRMQEGKTPTEDEIERAVKKAGFELRSFSPAQ